MKTLTKIEDYQFTGIEKSKANKIKETFEPMAEMLSSFEESYNNILKDASKDITDEITSRAKRLRLDISKVRIETGKLKDKQKEYIKLEDKAIMGVHNILVWAVKEKEDKLKDIEKHFELQEQKRLELLQTERAEKLSAYVEDAHERDLVKFEDDEFQALLSMKKKELEDRIAAEKKAEQERIAKAKAEAEERERIKKENESLKKEAEEREKLAKIEAKKRAKAEAIRKAKEEADRKEREEKDRKKREVYEAKIRAAKEEKQRIEREEAAKRRKLEQELQAKKEAELKAKKEAEAKIQAELNKNDAAKVQDLIKEFEIIKSKYSFKSSKNKKMYLGTCSLIDKIILYIKKQ